MDKNADLYREIFSRHRHATILFGLMDGRIEDVNDAALELYGYGREELIGLPFSSLAAEPEARLHRRKDGSMLAIDSHRSTVKIGGREIGVAVIHPMPVASDLFKEAACDIDHLLVMILNLTELAIKSLPAADPARMDLEEVRRLGQRAVKLAAPLKA